MSELPFYNEAAPLAALQAAGVAHKKSETQSTVNVSGVDIARASTAGEEHHFQLPQPATFKAAFGKEGALQKLAKVFSKELQTGDAEFDDKVFVRSADESTARFLQNDDVRYLIGEFVGEGGTVTVDGTKVVIHAVNQGMAAIVSEKELARFVCRVMAFG